MRCILALVALSLSWAQHRPTADRIADFTGGIPRNWQRHSFAGLTRYEQVLDEDGRLVLRATARGSASALGGRLRVRAADRPVIRWRWKAERLPEGGDETIRGRDDVAARLLLVFHESWRSSQVKAIGYVWGNTLTPGQVIDSPYSANVKIVAVESGRNALGVWKVEERDYAADYQRFFGEPADSLLGVSIMTDSDNTRSVAVAYYDYVELDRPRR